MPGEALKRLEERPLQHLKPVRGFEAAALLWRARGLRLRV